ncbi:MAG: helix-turn-helix domain-containing protein [Aristaeellaceae bacterium]
MPVRGREKNRPFDEGDNACQKGVAEMVYNKSITGEVIRNIRKNKGMTQEQLSGLVPMGRSHLAGIERGVKNANVDTLWKLAEALNMRLSTLIAKIEQAHGMPGDDRK